MSGTLADALALYGEQHYGEATAAFAALARAEPDAGRAAVLHTNAGTAAARAEDWGEAVWQLSRARLLAPRDPVARENLDRVRVLVGHGEPHAEEFTRTLSELPLRLTLAEDEAAAGACAGLALALLAAGRTRLLPRAAQWLGVVLLVASAGWWIASQAAWDEAAARAIIIPATAIGRAEPDVRSEVLFRLPEGTSVSVDEERRGWRLVQGENGARGWIAADEVRPLR